jgi:hypothetical protein
MPSGGCPGFCPQPRGIFPQRPSSCGLSRRPSSSSCPPCVGRANLLPTSLLIAQSPLGCQDPPYSKTLTPFPKREGGPDQARNSTERKGARPCSRVGPADPVLQVYSALLVIRVLRSERLPAKRLFCSCRQHCRRPTRRQVIPRPCASMPKCRTAMKYVPGVLILIAKASAAGGVGKPVAPDPLTVLSRVPVPLKSSRTASQSDDASWPLMGVSGDISKATKMASPALASNLYQSASPGGVA